MQQIFEPTTRIPYPATFQHELSPAWLRFAATLCGAIACDPVESFRYLELGCGRGRSALVHAASYRHAEFHALDRDTAAIESARASAKASGLGNIAFHAASFDDALRLDLGTFDFIALHGVYSWVDGRQRAILREILKHHLAPRGLAYVSYNCMPGWAAELPLRRLFQELSAARSALGIDGIRGVSSKIARLSASGLRYFSAQPAAARAVASWVDQDPGYLAHEYLAKGWEPLWSIDVIDDMARAGLRYAGSATLHDNHEELLVSPDTAGAIGRLETERLRTLAVDLAVNRSFRRDLFVRADAPEHAIGDRDAAVKNLSIGCPGDAGAIPDSIVVPRGRIRFRTEFIVEIRRALGDGPRSIGELAAELGGSEPETIRNVLWLTAAGALAPGFGGNSGRHTWSQNGSSVCGGAERRP